MAPVSLMSIPECWMWR